MKDLYMASFRYVLTPLALACSIALASCSSGGGDSATVPPAVTSITGTAEAPGGVIAQLEHNQAITVALTNFVFPPAHAGITGLQPVTGATVELIRIDDDGNQVGDVLATASTSITGNYSLELPTGVSLAGNLIVRITGNGGASMSAMVVEQAVDINPISQYVLSKFVDDPNLVLGDLPVNEVVSLQGKVEEFDLSATSDLSSMLAALDAEVGELVDNEITTIASTPDDGTAASAVAGTWSLVEFGLAMHDNESQTYGTFGLDVFSEEITIAATATAGEISLTTGTAFIDAWTNFSVDDQGVANIYHESSLGSSGDTFTAAIDANGNITLDEPFEEELETGANPQFGWRWPSSTTIVSNTGNDNVLVHLGTSAGVRYATTDTNNDGVNDAIDPNAKEGDEAEMLMTLLLKQGSGMTDASLNGDYGIVTLTADVRTNPGPIGSFGSTAGIVTFDASGSASVATDAFDELEIERQPNTSLSDITLTETTGLGGPMTFPYSVASNGRVILDTDNDAQANDPDDLEGFANDDASLVALLTLGTNGGPINQANQEIVLATKLGTSTPDVTNAVFKLYPMIVGMEDTGYSELLSLRSSSSLTFNAGATVATLDDTLRGFQRATDVSSVTALADEAEPAFDFNVSINTNGQIDLSEPSPAAGSDTTMKGYISADGKTMVLRFYGYDTAGDESRELGVIVAIRQ